MTDNKDNWVVRSSNFYDALVYAQSNKWAVHEWSWAPAHTTKNVIQVFKRWRIEDRNTESRE